MKVLPVAAMAAALVPIPGSAAFAQVATPASPRVGTPLTEERSGPPAPPLRSDPPPIAPRDGPLPANLTLEQALAEAEARSPALLAARAEVAAAESRLQQAGYRINPELSVELANFAGSGEYRGVDGVEATVSLNQRLDLGGRRPARIALARASLTVQQLRLAIARADLAREVREQFARAVSARDRLRLAEDSDTRARELARIAGQLVEAGREPPLRALRARSAAAQAAAALENARAEEQASRATLAVLFGATVPPDAVAGSLTDLAPRQIDPGQSPDVRLAEAERLAAEAALRQEQAAGRLDPAVGLGVRQFRGTGDTALVAGLSMPIPVFDRNRGNIDAARSGIDAADARRAGVLAEITVRARNAVTAVEAAEARMRALQDAALPEALEALRLTQQSYREGRSTLLELLDAQDAYTNAETALIDARLAYALATAELGRVAAQ
jgi:cobalt-zinc-cadmium efflux system outer membrane protein